MDEGITSLSEADAEAIASVVNEAAKTYDDTIPEDCYSQPYLSLDELVAEMETAEFHGYVAESAESAESAGTVDSANLVNSASLANSANSTPSATPMESRGPADALVGVVGFQEREAVTLIHRLYVLPNTRNEGIGSKLLDFALGRITTEPILVGTWRDADWAIGFYEKNGFTNLGTDRELLEEHWGHSERRNEESVVLRYER